MWIKNFLYTSASQSLNLQHLSHQPVTPAFSVSESANLQHVSHQAASLLQASASELASFLPDATSNNSVESPFRGTS